MLSRFFLIALLAANSLNAPAFASYGSRTVPSGDPLDNVLAAIGNQKSQFCSGAFVAPNVVLTAAHCVLTEEQEGIIGVGDYVYPLSLAEGFDPLRGERIKITKISLHPRKRELDIRIPIGPGDEYPFDNPDIALLKLERPYVDARPASIGQGELPPGARASYAGFGAGNENWQRPSRLEFRVLDGSYSAVGADYADLTEGNTYEFMKALEAEFGVLAANFTFVRSAIPGQQTLCYGDSGAPLFVRQGEGIAIYGVASVFIPHPKKGRAECGNSYLNVFAKLAAHGDWLVREINALARP